MSETKINPRSREVKSKSPLRKGGGGTRELLARKGWGQEKFPSAKGGEKESSSNANNDKNLQQKGVK